MVPEEIRRKAAALAGVQCAVNWCNDDAHRIDDENMAGVGPGEALNVFGWYVVGTTGGGNAIVVRADDPAVYYADHEWYGGDPFSFEDFGGTGARRTSRTIKDWAGKERVVHRLHGEWVKVPYTAEGVRRSLFRLAPSIDEFRARADEMESLIDSIT